MKCFNCGKETSDYLCSQCRREETLETVFFQILYFKAETCENAYLLEYADSLSDEKGVKDCIPDLLSCFPAEIAEYYTCIYYCKAKKELFELAAIQYLNAHDWAENNSQQIISYLLGFYVPNNFIKPREYCDWIAESQDACAELCAKAAEYYAMIAEYDLSDQMVEKGVKCDRFIYSDAERMRATFEKQTAKTNGYRTKKPYWPTTEERRRAVAMFYDEKGISYPRIESKPAKTPENEFEPIHECFELPDSYCAFWCAEAFSIASSKPIYQIAAVKVADGKILDEFQSFIRPQDGTPSRKSAVKEAGVSLSVIEGAEDVDQVMVKFFEFVGDAVLMSTGALGEQAKLLGRAARYTGMKRIPNELYDLLDLAAETDGTFDLENNNRSYILNALNLAEGKDALGKAKANINIYEALKNYGE